MTLHELFQGKVFITDLGQPQNVCEGEKNMLVERYAVWSPLKNSGGHQIVEVGGNLETLKSKYKIFDDSICTLA